MWSRKDLLTVALSATATFGLSLIVLLPRVANATADEKTTTVLSPVLHIGHCDVRAQVESNPQPADYKNATAQPPTSRLPGTVFVAAGPAPTIKLVIKNPTDAQATAAFSATLTASTSSPFARTMSYPQPKWTSNYNVVLKAGETQEIEIDPKTTLNPRSFSQFVLQDSANPSGRVTALSFNVTPQPPVAAAPAQSAPELAAK